MKILFHKSIFLGVLIVLSTPIFCQTPIVINGEGEGRIFEGIGTVSAGASSRLLIDYPEPYRSEILDYLFKPNFGAGFQHLKVEIGGDINSTDGVEPSHARTREEFMNPKPEYFHRGYEYWLLKEAKKRNKEIFLDCLEWGAPGWFNGGFYSQDNADYIVSFIKGAKKYWDIDMDYTGVWNETWRNGECAWIVNNLRASLDKNGLSKVKIVAPDFLSTDWLFADSIVKNEALKKAVAAIGYHYVKNSSTVTAQNCGLPLWESESGLGGGDWNAGLKWARTLNKNYILAKITKTENWGPVDAFYHNLVYPGTGPITANAPWCGYYFVEGGVWAVAHTTQFAQPGWKYIDSGCGISQGKSSYVTLKKPDGSGHYSIIIAADSVEETLAFKITGGLKNGKLHVWKSNKLEQFIEQEDIEPINGSFRINVKANTLYSLTTTTGQKKGTPSHKIPALVNFPENYSENFDSYAHGAAPRYWCDQAGAFEVYTAMDGAKTLRQLVADSLLTWDEWGPCDPEPFTEIGDQSFSNYEVSSDVFIENTGTAKIMGRIFSYDPKKVLAGYTLTIDNKGKWYLLSAVESIASGTVTFSAGKWHSLKLRFEGTKVKAFIDSGEVASVTNNDYSGGLAGLGSSKNFVQFDNFKIISLKK